MGLRMRLGIQPIEIVLISRVDHPILALQEASGRFPAAHAQKAAPAWVKVHQELLSVRNRTSNRCPVARRRLRRGLGTVSRAVISLQFSKLGGTVSRAVISLRLS